MSFSKTVSVVAALTSIFGAAAAGYKLSQDSQVNQTQPNPLEERIVQLEKELEEAKTQVTNVNPPTPAVLPQTQTQVQPQVTPTPPQLPPNPVPPAAPQPPTP